MAYCRFGPDSDVYLYISADDCFHCSGCGLIGPGLNQDFVAENHSEILLHLERHVAAGHKVPAEAVREIEKEAAEPKGADSQ